MGKKLNVKRLLSLCAGMATAVSSCQLIGDINDVRPAYTIPVEQSAQTLQSAQTVLNGVYASLRRNGFEKLPRVAETLGISAIPFSGMDETQLAANDVAINNATVQAVYLGAYQVIQQANLLIQTLEQKSPISAIQKAPLLGQARGLRALAHWHALQLFGQFYDINSAYGIVLRKSPATVATEISRSTVRESYAFILEDLAFAEANCEANTPNYILNQWAVKGLKARLMLYSGQYAEAAALAQQIITQSGRQWAANYTDNYQMPGKSPEILFAPYNSFDEDPLGMYGMPMSFAGSIYEETASKTDPRFGKVKGSYQFDNFRSTVVLLRLAEIHLIRAEALQRAAGPIPSAAAVAALNAVRTRAGVGLPAYTPAQLPTAAAVLKAIREEKLAELYNENGETWFDIVRHSYLGDVKAVQIKPSLDSPNKFILPIPYSEVFGSKNKVIQNPGYDSGI